MLQALERVRQAALVVAVLGEQLAGLIFGQRVPIGKGADFFGCRFVSHTEPTAPVARGS